MFVLVTLEDNVRVDPQDLGKPTDAAIAHVLESTFVDRVIADVGLVVTLYDIQSIGGGAVYHSDGGAHYQVRFRAVVFRPSPGEVLVGRVTDQDEHGLHLELGFFKDVYVPAEMLQQPAHFDKHANEWSWVMEEGSDPLLYSRNAEIRVRVHAVRFSAVPSLAAQAAQRDEGLPVEGTAERPHAPMTVVARCDGTGLGLIGWDWGENDE